MKRGEVVELLEAYNNYLISSPICDEDLADVINRGSAINGFLQSEEAKGIGLDKLFSTAHKRVSYDINAINITPQEQ
jgi:hypothetical protein